ncbi:MAG: hypothetical protein R3D62_19150 [Xanthobacteraceae bacterium]
MTIAPCPTAVAFVPVALAMHGAPTSELLGPDTHCAAAGVGVSAKPAASVSPTSAPVDSALVA